MERTRPACPSWNARVPRVAWNARVPRAFNGRGTTCGDLEIDSVHHRDLGFDREQLLRARVVLRCLG